MKRVNSIDVAKLAGVSQSTVSRVFAPNATVSAEKTRLVLDAAAELGYRPNALARGLITKSSGIVGVVVADVASMFYPYFLTSLTRRLNESGRRPLVFNVEPDEAVDDVLSSLLQYQVDALVIAATTLSAETVANATADTTRDGTPVVLFNRTTRLPGVSTVSIDNVSGGRQIADLFVENAHHRFGYIAGLPGTQSNEQRQSGFTSRLQELGVAAPLLGQGDYTYDSGYAAATEMLQRSDRPDAIFCAGDLMAMGAIDAARALGLSIPDDVSIAGFDGVPATEWASYQLTTVRQPINRLIDKTLEFIDAGQTDNKGEFALLSGDLLIRNSVKLI